MYFGPFLISYDHYRSIESHFVWSLLKPLSRPSVNLVLVVMVIWLVGKVYIVWVVVVIAWVGRVYPTVILRVYVGVVLLATVQIIDGGVVVVGGVWVDKRAALFQSWFLTNSAVQVHGEDKLKHLDTKAESQCRKTWQGVTGSDICTQVTRVFVFIWAPGWAWGWSPWPRSSERFPPANHWASLCSPASTQHNAFMRHNVT